MWAVQNNLFQFILQNHYIDMQETLIFWKLRKTYVTIHLTTYAKSTENQNVRVCTCVIT